MLEQQEKGTSAMYSREGETINKTSITTATTTSATDFDHDSAMENYWNESNDGKYNSSINKSNNSSFNASTNNNSNNNNSNGINNGNNGFYSSFTTRTISNNKSLSKVDETPESLNFSPMGSYIRQMNFLSPGSNKNDKNSCNTTQSQSQSLSTSLRQAL